MYKTRFVFRNGKDIVFVSESYDKARSLLLRGCISCGGELLYIYFMGGQASILDKAHEKR